MIKKSGPKVTRGMHYTTMLALIISNLSVLVIAGILAGPVMGGSMGNFVYWSEVGRVEKTFAKSNRPSFTGGSSGRGDHFMLDAQGQVEATRISTSSPTTTTPLFGGLSLGSPFELYTRNALNSTPIDYDVSQDFGEYRFDFPLTLTIGKQSIVAPSFSVNTYPATNISNQVAFQVSASNFEYKSLNIETLSLYLVGDPGVLPDDSLPTSLNLSEYNSARLYLIGSDTESGFDFDITGSVRKLDYSAQYPAGCDNISDWEVREVSTYGQQAAYVRAGATGVRFGAVRFDGVCEEADLDYLTIYIDDGAIAGTATGNYQDHTMSYIYDGSTLLASNAIPVTGKYKWTFPNGTLVIPKDGSKTLLIKADVATISSTTDNNPGTPAADIRFGFGGPNSAAFSGLNSGVLMPIDYLGSTTTGKILHKSIPTLEYSAPGNNLGVATSLVNGASDVYAFKVSVDPSGNNTLLYRSSFQFFRNPGDSFGLYNCYLKDSSNNIVSATSTYPVFNSNGVSNIVTYTYDNPDIDVDPEGEALEVYAGTSEVYKLNCTVAGANTGAVLGTAIVGDNAANISPSQHGTPSYVGLNTAQSYGTIFNGNFVWSDNYKNRSISAPTSTTANAIDWGQWYNGFLMPGFGISSTTYPYYIAWPN